MASTGRLGTNSNRSPARDGSQTGREGLSLKDRLKESGVLLFATGRRQRYVRHVLRTMKIRFRRDLPVHHSALRDQLDDFMHEARRNQQKLRRFQSFELRLIGTRSLFELIKAIIYPDYAVFHWDAVTLLLVDPDYEIRRILEDEGVRIDDHPTVMFARSWSELDALYPYTLFPVLGPYRATKHARLFLPTRPRPASVALLPLVRYGKLIGSLNIGSFHADRFVKGVLTDFFEHFAAVVAICLENATNTHRLKRQGLTDTLTGVNNRRFFDQRLDEEMAAARRRRRPLTGMLFDIDYFKQVNDTYGHQVGDQVLSQVAGLIRAQLRGSDVLARYGGEEFSALLAQTDNETAVEVAERVRKSVAGHTFTLAEGGSFKVTISIGLVTYMPLTSDRHQPRGDLLVAMADRSLYEAKGGGRNRVVSAGTVNLAEQQLW